MAFRLVCGSHVPAHSLYLEARQGYCLPIHAFNQVMFRPGVSKFLRSDLGVFCLFFRPRSDTEFVLACLVKDDDYQKTYEESLHVF